MYNFSYFKERDQKTILEFIDDFPFAFLTGSFLSGKQVATQLPLLLEERDGELFLQGHIMRNTDHYKALKENPNALLVFTGPSCYVSATWYSNPHGGSTWNYMSVHIAGNIRFMSDAELRSFMQRLTLQFEFDDTESPTVMENLPDDYVKQMMPAIVGFEIKADNIQNVFKLSQNRDEKSYSNIITELEKRGGDNDFIAFEMRKRKDSLFPKDV